MINLSESVGKFLELNGIGNYDSYGANGSIVSGKLTNKENNQIVLKYQSDKSFLGTLDEIGTLEVCVYNSNYNNAVKKLEQIRQKLNNNVIIALDANIGLTIKQNIANRDVSNETNLLCVVSTYTVDIKDKTMEV